MNNQFCSVVLFDTSSGVGRTWVFISLSILMDQLESEDVVNIYQTVKKLKYQRAENILAMVSAVHTLKAFLIVWNALFKQYFSQW